MNETLQIVRSCDASLFARLHETSGLDVWDHDWYQNLLSDIQVIGLVARVEEKHVGFVVFRIVPPESEVLIITTVPAMRRRGIGQALLSEVLKITDRRGAECIFLEVDIANASARRLYKNNGFVEVGRRVGYYRVRQGRSDALILRYTHS